MKNIFNAKGFTLMELMIVVAIIAILASISLPLISGAIDKARDAAEIADVRSVAASIAVFVSDSEPEGGYGKAFKAAGETEIPDTVIVNNDGTVIGKEPIRTDKIGLTKGEYPIIEFGKSLTSTASVPSENQ